MQHFKPNVSIDFLVLFNILLDLELFNDLKYNHF